MPFNKGYNNNNNNNIYIYICIYMYNFTVIIFVRWRLLMRPLRNSKAIRKLRYVLQLSNKTKWKWHDLNQRKKTFFLKLISKILFEFYFYSKKLLINNGWITEHHYWLVLIIEHNIIYTRRVKGLNPGFISKVGWVWSSGWT